MSFIDVKYIGLISSRLEKFSQKKIGLYNFRCPYCGDSKRHKNKTRGYIYKSKNDHNYKCHNCGVSKSFTYFLKDFDTSLYDQYVMERYKDGLTGRGSNTPNPKFNFEKPKFTKRNDEVVKINLPLLSELNTEHPARAYIENRKIPTKYLNKLYYCEKFKQWTNSIKHTFESIEQDEPRIIIPLVKDKKIFGFQGRSLDKKSKIKYITVILEDTHGKIYGLDDISKGLPCYVVEGPFDSTFITNSVALCGSDGDVRGLEEYDLIFVYDNEPRNKEIVNRVGKCISKGRKVVIWPSGMVEKDINDMVLSGHNVMDVLESNTYKGLEAELKFNIWKRV